MPDQIVERFGVHGAPEDHVARLQELRTLGVDQFPGYLQHDAKDQARAAYGDAVIPRVAPRVAART